MTDKAVEIRTWGRRLKKFIEAHAQAETEEHRKMLEDYIDKNLMPQLYDIYDLPKVERQRIDEEAEAAVDAQIAAEIEAFLQAILQASGDASGEA